MRNQSEPSNFAAIKMPISQEALDQLFGEALRIDLDNGVGLDAGVDNTGASDTCFASA
jgi:hypothetical protein